MSIHIFHLTQSGALTHLGLLVALCGNIQADGWLERERTFYQLRQDERGVRVELVWNILVEI